MGELEKLRIPCLVAIALTIALAGCGTAKSAPGESPTRTPFTTTTPASSAAPPPASPTIDDLPTTRVTPVVIESGINVDQVEPGGVSEFHRLTAAAGDVWLGSPNGLVRIDPDTNTADVVDADRGAAVSGTGNILWRAGFYADKVMRYDATSGKRTFTHDMTGPLEVLATPSAAWVGLHTLGRVLKLDIDTGDVLADTIVGSTDCCGAGDFVQVGDSIWVVVNKDSTMVELDPATGEVLQTVHSDAHLCDGLNYVLGALWSCTPSEVVDGCTGAVRFDPATGFTSSVVLPRNKCLVYEAAGSAWVPLGDQLIQVDPVSAVPLRAVDLGVDGYDATNVNETLGSVWVFSSNDTRVLRIDPDELR